jgi:hypothetical protein
MPTAGTWVGAMLMGCGLSAVVSLIALRSAFVRAAVWQKALFLLMIALSSIMMVLVFAFGSQVFRPAILSLGIAAYVGFGV